MGREIKYLGRIPNILPLYILHSDRFCVNVAILIIINCFAETSDQHKPKFRKYDEEERRAL